MKFLLALILVLSLSNFSFSQDCSNSSILQAAGVCYNVFFFVFINSTEF